MIKRLCLELLVRIKKGQAIEWLLVENFFFDFE